MNYTHLLNKPIISIFDGKNCGKVQYALFNNMNKMFSIVVNQNENFKAVDIKDVFALNDCIMIRNSTKIMVHHSENTNSFLDKEVFTVLGKRIGKIVELVLDDKFYIDKIVTDKLEFSPKSIVTNKNIIIINNDNSHYKAFQFAPKTKISIPNNQPQKVLITTKIPVKVNSKNHLIGKKLFKDFISKNNIILARKNSIVTYSLLNIAKENNALFELTTCIM